MLYCAAMEQSKDSTERVARWLRRSGLEGVAAFILEAAGPLVVIGAQAAYLIEPLFGSPDSPLGDFARVMEDPGMTSALIEQLRQEDKPS